MDPSAALSKIVEDHHAKWHDAKETTLQPTVMLADGIEQYCDGPQGPIMALGWRLKIGNSFEDREYFNVFTGRRKTIAEWNTAPEQHEVEKTLDANRTPLERAQSPVNADGLHRDGPLGRLMAKGWQHQWFFGTKFQKNVDTNELKSPDEWDAEPHQADEAPFKPSPIPIFTQASDTEIEDAVKEDTATQDVVIEDDARPMTPDEIATDLLSLGPYGRAVLKTIKPLAIKIPQPKHRKIEADLRRMMRTSKIAATKPLSTTAFEGLREFLRTTLRNAAFYTEGSKRTTVTALDVVYGLKRNLRVDKIDQFQH